MLINMIGENESGATPSVEELAGWAETYGMTLPVVADPGFETAYSYATGGSIGLPFIVLLDRGMVVSKVGATLNDADRLLE